MPNMRVQKLDPKHEGFSFLNSKKCNVVSNLTWYQYMVPRGCGKKLRMFHKVYDVHFLETGPSTWKNRDFEREYIRFEGKVAAFICRH